MLEFREMKNTSLNSKVIQYIYEPSNSLERRDIYEFLLNCKPIAIRKIRYYLELNYSVKCRHVVKLELVKQIFNQFGTAEEVQKLPAYFTSRTKNIIHKTEVKRSVYKGHSEIITDLENFISLGSGYTLRQCQYYFIELYLYNPLRGGCAGNILPPAIKHKRCTLSIDTTDNRDCFAYSILASLYPVKKHPEMKGNYADKLGVLKGLKYPMKIADIPLFEKENSISINVYSSTAKGKVFVVRLTKLRKPKLKHIDLFLYKSHYFLIRHMSRLLCNTNSRNRRKAYYCKLCLAKYNVRRALQAHMLSCNSQRLSLPKPGSKIVFKDIKACFMRNFCYYFDCETFNCQEFKQLSGKTTQLGYQAPFCVGIYKVCYSNEKYTGKDVKIFKGL